MSVKIRSLEVENVKRVKAVTLMPTETGLTVIGGNNGQGKTSVLDAIAWALGGDKLRPSDAQRRESVIPPRIHIELSNGLIVERKGKSSALHVIDPTGQKAGQRLLDSFIEKLALNLPKFMQASNKEKADTLLKIIGIGDELAGLEQQEQSLYNQRLEIGRIADRKRKHVEEMEYYPDAPDEPVSAADLIRRQQDILARNGENQRKRDQLAAMLKDKSRIEEKIAELQAQLAQYTGQAETLAANIETAQKTVAELQDESTAELEASITNIDAINVKVRANADKVRAQQEAEELSGQYNDLSAQIDDVRKAKLDLLGKAHMPLAGLSVNDGELTYQGQKWDCMSGAEQLKVSTAIIRCLNPECGFVLMDKLEQMDRHTLAAFGDWLEQEGLQVIATRVGTDDTCSIIIEDGYVQGQEAPAAPVTAKQWQVGTF